MALRWCTARMETKRQFQRLDGYSTPVGAAPRSL